jgi:tetratricopeptide (TPR) repeat protein
MKSKTMNSLPNGILVALLFASISTAAPYVLLPGNVQKVGTSIRADSSGTIKLITADGATLSFAKGQYVKAVADKPVDFDAARQKATAKDYAGAETILKRIVVENAFLEWDNNARIVLAREVYGAKGDYANAVATLEEIFRVSPEKKNDPQVGWAYRDALLGAKQYEKLSLSLDELIKTGSRTDAAKAQIMRGDIKTSQGQIEGATMDYLRTVILFENERDVQPEALYKAAEALEKNRDPRAKGLYAKLRDQYAASPYAAKAAGK